VAVFAVGDAAREAEAAGAEFVGAEDLAAQIEGGMLDFDVTIATPDLMPLVGRLGRVLGPRGLMPNPKTGTVTNEVGKAVEEFKGGKVEYRTDRHGNVHVPLGKVSFELDALTANLAAVSKSCIAPSRSSAKGRYFRKVTVVTMGPVKVDPNRPADGPTVPSGVDLNPGPTPGPPIHPQTRVSTAAWPHIIRSPQTSGVGRPRGLQPNWEAVARRPPDEVNYLNLQGRSRGSASAPVSLWHGDIQPRLRSKRAVSIQLEGRCRTWRIHDPKRSRVVEEVRGKLEGADAVLLTEYRGLKVTELAPFETRCPGRR
jgi:hypothetical protein